MPPPAAPGAILRKELSIDFAIERSPRRQSAELAATPSTLEEDLAWLRLNTQPANLSDRDPLAIVDLFCGLGGMALGALEGARQAGRGARLALAADLEPEALTVLRSTFGVDASVARKVDLGTLFRNPGQRRVLAREQRLFENVSGTAVLLAGPPCQGHSALNNHTRHDDPRNDLYLVIARAVEVLMPKFAIIENVRGVGNDRRGMMQRCVARLEELGYEVVPKRISLEHLGVPQKRIRHVLVAALERSFVWPPAVVPARSVGWAIADLLDIESKHVPDTPAKMSIANRERINWLFDEDEYNLPNRLRPKCHHDDHTYISMYGRLRWDEPAQTITSGFGSMGQGRYVHPLRRRTLTAHEAARLQFLPDFVALADASTRRAMGDMIGNVAPPALTIALVRAAIAQGLV